MCTVFRLRKHRHPGSGSQLLRVLAVHSSHPSIVPLWRPVPGWGWYPSHLPNGLWLPIQGQRLVGWSSGWVLCFTTPPPHNYPSRLGHPLWRSNHPRSSSHHPEGAKAGVNQCHLESHQDTAQWQDGWVSPATLRLCLWDTQAAGQSPGAITHWATRVSDRLGDCTATLTGAALSILA